MEELRQASRFEAVGNMRSLCWPRNWIICTIVITLILANALLLLATGSVAAGAEDYNLIIRNLFMAKLCFFRTGEYIQFRILVVQSC